MIYLSSTIISISTEILLGSAATPNAERACFPLSPKTSTIKLENPFITAGCCTNVGSEFTNPSTAQIIHNLFGFLTYLTVPCCILLLGVGLRKTNHSRLSNHGIFLGSLSSLFVLYLFLNPLTHFIGMYQRIIESIFLLWIISCATTLKKMNHDD